MAVAMKKGKTYIGTSGWHYQHWKGNFYPEEIADSAQLAYYAEHFGTVELNNSFYHLPPPETFSNWRKKTPAGFIFAVKGSRYITHLKKLQVDSPVINTFLSNAGNLEEKMGPVLWQFPPRWKINTARLLAFLELLPPKFRYTFEFRDHSWYDTAVYELLKQYNCAFCIYQLNGHLSPITVTANWVYIRLHGPGGKYEGSYRLPTLQKWAKQCEHWNSEGKDAYCYFDNDQSGYAAANAVKMKQLME